MLDRTHLAYLVQQQIDLVVLVLDRCLHGQLLRHLRRLHLLIVVGVGIHRLVLYGRRDTAGVLRFYSNQILEPAPRGAHRVHYMLRFFVVSVDDLELILY